MNDQNFSDFVERNKWISSKTYENTAPHEYIVKDKLSPDDQKIFEEAVQFIRENGYEGSHAGKKYVYHNLDVHKYWTMGAPIGETTILNRAYIRPIIL